MNLLSFYLYRYSRKSKIEYRYSEFQRERKFLACCVAQQKVPTGKSLIIPHPFTQSNKSPQSRKTAQQRRRAGSRKRIAPFGVLSFLPPFLRFPHSSSGCRLVNANPIPKSNRLIPCWCSLESHCADPLKTTFLLGTLCIIRGSIEYSCNLQVVNNPPISYYIYRYYPNTTIAFIVFQKTA